MPSSAIISIGNELLLGRTLNTNMAWLAAELASLGVPAEYSVTVKDESEAIGEALKHCWERFDVVITTGGLGPTDDDISKRAIADFFGVELVFDAEVWARVQAMFAARKMPTPQVNRNQALVPKGFTALRNERGTAPGLYFSQGSKRFFAFAGVPLEMKHVFETGAKPLLVEAYGLREAISQKTLHTFGISESALAEKLAGIIIPSGVNLAWLPQTGRVDLRLYGADAVAIEKAAADIRPLIAEYVWGEDSDTPVSVLSELLRKQGLTLSCAESCTGGLVQAMLTELAGASDVLLGGIVAYANEVKREVLGVTKETLVKYGAVSEECAGEMARGIKSLTNSSTAISVTGVAGPEGGSSDKPVGTVCFGFSYLSQTQTRKQIFTGDRASIRYKAAEYALLTLARIIQGK